jgi:sugar lactone lactonase YvrE
MRDAVGKRSLFGCLAILLIVSAGCVDGNADDVAEANEMVEEEDVVLTEIWRLEEGLDRPESVIYDTDRSVLYVTNLVGPGDEMDGIGYISRVSLDGEMVDPQWIDGLNAPKGLAFGGDRLYATDINTLLEIDVDTGEILARHTVDGDAYLNDVTIGPDGTVFASDSRYSKIYVLRPSGLEVWLEDPNIVMPNGVHVVGDELFIAAADSTAEEPGAARYLQAASLSDKSIRALSAREPVGALDAVEPDGAGGLFVTDWGSGHLMHFDGSDFALLEELGEGAADVDYVVGEGMLYVPVMMENQLIAYQVDL